MDTTFFDLYADKTIPDIIVDALTKMTSGVTGSISKAFDALILNDAKTGLSALAIWVLSFAGVGFLWKVIPMAIRRLSNRR